MHHPTWDVESPHQQLGCSRDHFGVSCCLPVLILKLPFSLQQSATQKHPSTQAEVSQDVSHIPTPAQPGSPRFRGASQNHRHEPRCTIRYRRRYPWIPRTCSGHTCVEYVTHNPLSLPSLCCILTGIRCSRGHQVKPPTKPQDPVVPPRLHPPRRRSDLLLPPL